MATTTLLVLDRELLRATGDWLNVAVTTAIAASKLIVSTALNNYDHGSNGIFDNRWVYIEDFANAAVSRLLGSTTYATATGTAYVYGANLTTDNANLATVRISRSSWADRVEAISRAIATLYPKINRSLDDRTLILGNILPDGHFESWSSATALTHYSKSSVTLARTTTAGLIRGGTYSCKITADAANGYVYISSDTRPELLTLAGKTIDFKCWAYPEVADDFNLVIWTIKKDGTTTQTLTSTTTAAAGRYSLVGLENQTINTDLEEIQFRFKVATNAKYTYVDDARVTGVDVQEFLLPDALQSGGATKGGIGRVKYQVSGNGADADVNLGDMCDDIGSQDYTSVYGWDTIGKGGYSWLYLPSAYASLSNRRLHLIGTQPYEALSVAADTISTADDREIELIVAFAAYLLYEMKAGPISASDTEKYDREMARFYNKYQRLLLQHGSSTRSGTLHINPL